MRATLRSFTQWPLRLLIVVVVTLWLFCIVMLRLTIDARRSLITRKKSKLVAATRK